jgi:hypothetical protein
MGQGISTGEARLLAGMHTNRRTLACRFALTFSDRDQSCVSVGIDIEAVVPWFDHSERLIRRVNFVDFAIIKVADMHVHGALV